MSIRTRGAEPERRSEAQGMFLQTHPGMLTRTDQSDVSSSRPALASSIDSELAVRSLGASLGAQLSKRTLTSQSAKQQDSSAQASVQATATEPCICPCHPASHTRPSASLFSLSNAALAASATAGTTSAVLSTALTAAEGWVASAGGTPIASWGMPEGYVVAGTAGASAAFALVGVGMKGVEKAKLKATESGRGSEGCGRCEYAGCTA